MIKSICSVSGIQTISSKLNWYCFISILNLILKLLKWLTSLKLIWKLILSLIRWLLWIIIKDELTPDHV